MLAAVLVEEEFEVAVGAEFGLDEEVAGLLPGVDEGDEVGRVVLLGGEEAEDVDFLEATKAARRAKVEGQSPKGVTSRQNITNRSLGPPKGFFVLLTA